MITSKDVVFLSLGVVMAAFVSITGNVFNSKVVHLQDRVAAVEAGQAKSYGLAVEALQASQNAPRAIPDDSPAILHTERPEAQEGPSLPVPGDTVIVYDPEAGGAYLTKEESWAAAQKAFKLAESDDAESERILKKLDDEGQCILEENGIRLKILQGRFFTFKVKVLNGANRDWEGWIPRKLVKKVESQ